MRWMFSKGLQVSFSGCKWDNQFQKSVFIMWKKLQTMCFFWVDQNCPIKTSFSCSSDVFSCCLHFLFYLPHNGLMDRKVGTVEESKHFFSALVFKALFFGFAGEHHEVKEFESQRQSQLSNNQTTLLYSSISVVSQKLYSVRFKIKCCFIIMAGYTEGKRENANRNMMPGCSH